MDQDYQHSLTQCKLFTFFKICIVSLFLFSICYQGYNIYRIENLQQKIISTYQELFTLSRRFSSYYNNADSERMPVGIYSRFGTNIIVNKATEVKLLSEGIAKLKSELKCIAPESIWTIAVLENPANYGHFDPLRPDYRERYASYTKNSLMNRIVRTEGIEDTYKYFYGCNIRLTDTYIEQGSNERIRTIYYPIYNDKKLESILAIDIKTNLIQNIINNYNKKELTVINNNQSHNIYSSSISIPCSSGKPITVGINYIDLLKKSSSLAFVFSSIIFVFYLSIENRTHFLQRDRMTGFYRRDFYEKKLNKLDNFSMLLIDIDNFKKINDTYGHKKGDDVIRQVARLIMDNIRQKDIAIRWGGEEFIIIFNSMDCSSLYSRAEYIRNLISREPICGLDITISIGGLCEQDTTFTESYRRADAALYESKHNGRNRVTII
ncbi:GGDEF domain-containing protein [Photobacterium damselae]|uniref:GGDEF domain-containing protein n=1 Tax=Photobacterium damselae TaxID=38293 RepID=UPI00083B74D2|nr:GGDEF domain-containing protein [Photobacterium damselae]ODA21228.1 diguanylate cyclase [Photobacterium damselae subsp. damselae]